MTTREIELIKNSWKTLRDVESHIIGDVFYSKLFLEAPQLKSLFTTSIKEQSAKLIAMLNVVIARLEQLDHLKKDIQLLAIRHKGYGVKTAHYDMVGNALLWTLEKALGVDWTEELALAWTNCYTTLASAMISATESSIEV